MQAFNELRSAARDRRDKLIDKARREYDATLAQICRLEQDLLGKEPADHKSIASCVSSVIPSNRPFTINDLVQSLETLDPRRPWRNRSVAHAVQWLRDKGIIKRVSPANRGRAKMFSGAVYIRAGVKALPLHYGEDAIRLRGPPEQLILWGGGCAMSSRLTAHVRSSILRTPPILP